MEIAISSPKVKIPQDVRSLTEEKVTRLEKYLDGIDHAEVSFKKEKNPRIAECEICEVTVRGHGYVVRAHASSIDQLAAVDEVVEKLKHQLGKLKIKQLTRHNHGHNGNGNGKGNRERKLVKTKTFSVDYMEPEEAVARMDLLGHDFFLFTDSETGKSAVVYRRDDGDVGLITTHES